MEWGGLPFIILRKGKPLEKMKDLSSPVFSALLISAVYRVYHFRIGKILDNIGVNRAFNGILIYESI